MSAKLLSDLIIFSFNVKSNTSKLLTSREFKRSNDGNLISPWCSDTEKLADCCRKLSISVVERFRETLMC